MKYVKYLKEALSQEAIDGILDRISEVGWDGISDKEKEILKKKDEVDDFVMNFIKVIHKEPPVSERLKLYPLEKKGQVDDDLKIIILKPVINDDGFSKFFITFRFLDKDSPLYKIVGVCDFKKRSMMWSDVYGNNIFDKDYTENIKNYVKKQDLDNFQDNFYKKVLPVVNYQVIYIQNYLHSQIDKDSNNQYDSDLDNLDI